MELKDLLVTPILVILILTAAYLLRGRFTNDRTRPFFMSGLILKICGAILLGIVYQYYYQGGDTFNYYKQSTVIYDAFYESPLSGLKLLFSNGEFDSKTFKYAQYIYWYKSPTEYFIIKVAAFLGLLCFNTYSSIAVLFAVLSFTGLWALYITFLKQSPNLSKPLGMAIFYLPSVFFWGSGLMKDTITLGALGWLFYGFYQGLIEKRRLLFSLSIILISLYIIFQVKVYILLSFLPPAILWVFFENSNRIKNKLATIILKPVIIFIGGILAYLAAVNVTEGDIKYDIENIGTRTKINAEYLYRISMLQDGSGYYLGELDGSVQSMLLIAPQAVNVTLFRPYLWEIGNPLMLLAALESFLFTLLFLSLFIKPGIITSIYFIFKKPIVTFCFLFTIILAFAVGLNSYNFGTLVRYKIQLLPFFLAGIVMIRHYAKDKDMRSIAGPRFLSSHMASDLS